MQPKRAFTLVELLIVIAIVAILVAIGSISFVSAMKQSRDTRRKADLEQIRGALETFRSENGIYPSTATGLSSLSPDYITTLPEDPSNPATPYLYTDTSSGDSISYELCATLESETGAESCNYIVTNP